MMETVYKPWLKKTLTPTQEQKLYRDWGSFFKIQNQLDKAEEYYSKSLEMRPEDPETLYMHSVCRRHLAKTKKSLADALAARDLFRKTGGENADTAAVNNEICNALYELNRFEDCMVELHDNVQKFIGQKVAIFNNNIIVLDENFKDSLGDNLGPFIAKHEKCFPEVMEKIKAMKNIDKRPLWKIMKEQEKCDVLSILDKEEELLSPLEVARRARSYNVFHQMYMNRTWKDILFLKNLRKNPHFLPPYFRESTPKLKQLVETKYEIVRNFAKMLHARSPMYNEIAVRCPVKEVSEKHHDDYMTRVQYQTRRNMMKNLRTIRSLRAKQEIEKLSKYVEDIMGNYVVLKTTRAMPWKFEFLNEVYNLYGLAHLDCYKITNEILMAREKHRLQSLLRIDMDLYADHNVVFKFGDKSTYQEPNAIDYAQIRYKQFLRRMEKRLHFAKHGIERAYIHHEMANAHLKRSRFNECCVSARMGMIEGRACKSRLWQFLNCLLTAKSHVIQGKREHCKDALEEAEVIATGLHNENLEKFVEMCLAFNKQEISVKKSQSVLSTKIRRGTTTTHTESSSILTTEALLTSVDYQAAKDKNDNEDEDEKE